MTVPSVCFSTQRFVRLFLSPVCLLLPLWLTGGGLLQACDVPVFRYALERWPVDPYQAVAVEVTPFDAAEKAALETLRASSRKEGLNLRVQVMKPKAFAENAYGREVTGEVKANRLFLFYPKTSGLTRSPWNGPVSGAAVTKLATCGDRKKLMDHLLGGSSAVFLFLASGDRGTDDKARLLLEERLKALAREIKLPAKVAAAGEKAADPVNQLKSKVPFKIHFTLQTVPKAGPQKTVLRPLLLGLEADLVDLQNQPMVFLVYGRGRALPPLIGKGINQKMIDQLAYFVTGACSCQVKAQNPGTDLLLSRNWDKAILGKGEKK